MLNRILPFVGADMSNPNVRGISQPKHYATTPIHPFQPNHGHEGYGVSPVDHGAVIPMGPAFGARPVRPQIHEVAPARPTVLTFGAKQPWQEWKYGANVVGKKGQFKLWAPRAKTVKLILFSEDTLTAEDRALFRKFPMSLEDRQERLRAIRDRADQVIEMDGDRPKNYQKKGSNIHYAEVDNIKPGQLYMYELDYPYEEDLILPDYYSRFQPYDVHGPSMVVDPNQYQWKHDKNWANWEGGVAYNNKLMIYNFHVGTFTPGESKQPDHMPGGTIRSAIDKLDYIADMGYNAIYLNPLNEFPGTFNWGYDMANLTSIENSYGNPKDFQEFVDRAHELGLKVIVDVVLNHTGPEGTFYNFFDNGDDLHGYNGFTVPGHVYNSSWGDALNWKHPMVHQYAQDVLEQWVREYHVDGFRFDMSERIPDQYMRDQLQGLYGDVLPRVFKDIQDGHHRQIKVILEDGRNGNYQTLPTDIGGLGGNIRYNFQFAHHVISAAHKQVHGDAPTDYNNMFRLFVTGAKGSTFEDLYNTLIFSQSHDEVGNDRARGSKRLIEYLQNDRWHNKEMAAAHARLMSLFKYVVPGVPMNFMGEEFNATAPFHFFKNYEGQDDSLFRQCQVNWNEYNEQFNRRTHDLTRAMVYLRQRMESLYESGGRLNGNNSRQDFVWERLTPDYPVFRIHRWDNDHGPGDRDETIIYVNLSEQAFNHFDNAFVAHFPENQASAWKEVLNTDEQRYGGLGRTNANNYYASRQNHAISLPPFSMAIFAKADKAPAIRQELDQLEQGESPRKLLATV